MPIYISGSKKTEDGITIVAAQKTEMPRFTIVTHDWADPTTWYSEAVRIEDEIAINTGDNIKYSVFFNNVIDVYHGHITQEDLLSDQDGYSYRVSVSVNESLQIEQDPHLQTGDDYTVNYSDGYVDFLYTLQPSDTVKVTYHHATSSIFTIAPATADVALKIGRVEVQFSHDIDITDSIIFQPYGSVDEFAPHLTPDPLPPGTAIEIGTRTVYKTMRDYQNDSNQYYPSCPSMGGNSWRALLVDVAIFSWEYTSLTVLHGKYGMSIQLYLEHDIPFEGTISTITFYGFIEDDAA